MTAVPADGFIFSGWFEGDEKLTSDYTYSFVVKGHTALEALFEEKNPVGVRQETYERNFVVRPLPLSEVMYLEGDFTTIRLLRIYGIDGTVKLTVSDVPRGEPVDVSSLGKGLYIIKAVTDKGMHAKSVLKK